MYKQIKFSEKINNSAILRMSDNACIPFALDNTDYQQFKKDITQGVALNDADGNAMSAEAITTFLATLP